MPIPKEPHPDTVPLTDDPEERKKESQRNLDYLERLKNTPIGSRVDQDVEDITKTIEKIVDDK